ncbi:EAL domain-containing protein [Arthrobacter sp. 24S4-2]|uniref:EAL domain-containing protein n=1 Tax=Arthrobacter sp. 24S4-2 TaxID=2575374 RepID=UPI001C2F2806|nr:EAL domain-containing protein [Arthrobacter sp. 24S4-2]
MQLRELVDAGIGVALDDYGTGHSSLSLLRELPLTAVKIDESLIDTIDALAASSSLGELRRWACGVTGTPRLPFRGLEIA